MIDQQLYIDGNLMDMDDGVSVPLDIKSNMFQDIANMTSNNTYTVNLPKTVHNLSVLGRVDVPKSSTRSPFVFHTCRYYRGGVEIISNGRATVLSVADSIEIAIYWGIFPVVNTLQTDDTKLSDLVSDAHVLYKKTNTPSSYDDAIKDGIFYADYNPYQIAEDSDDWVGKSSNTVSNGSSTRSSGSNYSGDRRYIDNPIQPCVSCRWILNLIKSTMGIDFSFDGDARSYINSLAIPLVNHKADEQTITGALDASIADTTVLGQLSFTLNDSTTSFKQKKGETATQLDVVVACELNFDIGMTWSWDASKTKTFNHVSWTDQDGNEQTEWVYYYYGNYIEVKIVSKHEDGDDESDYTKYYYVGKAERDNDKITDNEIINYQSNKIDGRFTHRITGSGKISLEEGDVITFTMGNTRGKYLDMKCYDGTIKASLSDSDDVPFGGMFPIAKNLPEINVMDFIKFLALVSGTFPRQSSSDGNVSFVSFAKIWENRDEALDWSRRIVAGFNYNTPRSMDFSVGSYCKRNRYKWKEDDTVQGSYDAEMVIDNETLDAEQDVWTLPFAASDGERIPLFANNTETDDKKELKYKGCKDRIMMINHDLLRNAVLSFDIDLQSILDEKYSQLRATIENAHVITEYIYLSDLEIKNFDESIPVYLAQYGAYFAVTELKVSDNGYTEATMIQLEF